MWSASHSGAAAGEFFKVRITRQTVVTLNPDLLRFDFFFSTSSVDMDWIHLTESPYICMRHRCKMWYESFRKWILQLLRSARLWLRSEKGFQLMGRGPNVVLILLIGTSYQSFILIFNIKMMVTSLWFMNIFTSLWQSLKMSGFVDKNTSQ